MKDYCRSILTLVLALPWETNAAQSAPMPQPRSGAGMDREAGTHTH